MVFPRNGPSVTLLAWSSRSMRIQASPIGPSGSGLFIQLPRRRPPPEPVLEDRLETQGIKLELRHGVFLRFSVAKTPPTYRFDAGGRPKEPCHPTESGASCPPFPRPLGISVPRIRSSCVRGLCAGVVS